MSKYDLESNIVTLVQVPEYPVIPEKIDDEASTALPETSSYQEDGSLEVCLLRIAFLTYVCFHLGGWGCVHIVVSMCVFYVYIHIWWVDFSEHRLFYI